MMNRKARRFLRILALCMAVVIGIGMLPVSVSATETGTEGTENSGTLTYLALGDSITAGYRLTNVSTEGFVAQFANEIGATTTVNAGVSGLTAETLATTLATALNDPTNEAYAAYVASIKTADVITITIGGNDLMAAFYEAVANLYNSQYSISAGGTDIDANTVKTVLADPTAEENATLASALIGMLGALNETTAASLATYFSTAITECVFDISSIVSSIRAINYDAVILVANQYNPYQWLVGVDVINSLFGTVVGSFNSALSDAAASSSDFTVVDVCSAFSASSTSLTNASIIYDMSSGTPVPVSYDFDFHPNAAGHSTIAAAMKEAYYYTWEIPLQLTAIQSGSVAVPSQTFEVEILDWSYEPLALATIYGTLVANSVSVTDGAGTYNASLTFTGNEHTYDQLADGFFVRMVDGGVDGWTYDDTIYKVNAYFGEDTNEISELFIEEVDQTSTALLTAALNSSLQALSFECSYTGWHLYFETDGGSSIDSVEAANNTTLDLSAYTPTRSGYTFAGWYADSALTSPVESVTLTQDATVYAKWTEVVSEGEDNNSTEDTDDTDDKESDDSVEAEVVAEVVNDTETTTPVSIESAATGDKNSLLFWIALIAMAGLIMVSRRAFSRQKQN